jgi:tRNA threonylcarbamoyladenosine biosynthesis protein TsaB
MNLLAFDTATPATVIATARDPDHVVIKRHDPTPGARPAHATALLPLVDEALAAAGLDLADVERLGVGIGPGSFTGLRIGLATARGLAQALGLPLAPVSSLQALAAGASAEVGPDRAVLAVIDAGRGEGFALAVRGDRRLGEPAALGPEALAQAVAALAADPGQPAATPLAVGGGAVRFQAQLRAAGAAVPADESPLHRLDGRQLCRLAAAAETADRDAVLPHYARAPDATPHPQPNQS